MEGDTSPTERETTAEYVAPYIRLPPGVTSNRYDITYFREGYTLKKHREAIGRSDASQGRFRGRYQKYILQRGIDEEELERVLRDPGVEKVVQVTREMEVAAMKADRTLVTFPDSIPAPGYMIYFTNDKHTLEEHFATIGMRFDIERTRTEGGYDVKYLPRSATEKILTDPNVWIVVQGTYGGFPEDVFRRRTSDPDYLAPYHRLPDGQTTTYDDMIYFRKGHTLQQHFHAIAQWPTYFQYQTTLLQRDMDKDELERSRRDPGVEKVVQVTKAMRRAAMREDRSLVRTIGFDPAPGYFVIFANGAYTLDEHFERIGERFDDVTEVTECGYFVKVPEFQLQKIFTDPNVDIIEQNKYAKY